MNSDSPLRLMEPNPEYQYRVEFWAILACVGLLAVLVELVRRHRLKERYSLLWFLTAIVLITFVIRRDWLEDLAGVLGIYYPPTALVLLLVFFMILILIHYSTVLTRLLRDNQRLVQELGVMESRIRELEREHASRSVDPEE